MKKRVLLLTALFAAVSGSAFAQQGFGGGMGRMFGPGQMNTMTSLMLLQRPDVQEELKIGLDQKAKLDALKEGARSQFQTLIMSLRDLDPDERQAKVQALIDDLSKQGLDVLTDDQKKRLKELSIQSVGTMVVLNTEISKTLGVTEAQKAKIDDLQRKMKEANEGLRERVQSGDIDRDAYFERVQKNQKALEGAVAKLLNDDQRTKLKALGGKPFEFQDPKPGTPGSFPRPGG